MNRFFLTAVTCLFSIVAAFSQIAPENVKTVQLYPVGNEVGLPIIELKGQQKLQLEFDVLGEDAPYVYYEIQHFTADWRKKDLNPLDYIKGFHTGNIDDFEFSFNTNQLYTHYEFQFPNQQVKFKASGNYKILVYEDSVNEPLFEKRFYVTEQAVAIQGGIENALSMSQLESHHQVNFSVSYDGLTANNPREEFDVNVMQNYREDNMLIDIKPNRIDRNTMVFNNPFDFNFEAGNEFRWFNIRSVRYKTQGVAEIITKDGRTDVWLIPALERKRQQFVVFNDFNGQFVVDHQEGNRPDIDGDYVHVHFTLKETPEIKGKDVYVFGGLTNWEVKPEYKLEMNERQNLLQADMYLKQGNYDYQYVVKQGDGYTTTPIEGSFYRTENQYTVFVYYAPFGSRYDRLVGVKVYSSIFN